MKDGGCSLTFAKVMNPNITELERLYRRLGVRLKKLTKLASSTLS
jgi:hypothetical protein